MKINYFARETAKLGRQKIKIYLSNLDDNVKQKELDRIESEINKWIESEVLNKSV